MFRFGNYFSIWLSLKQAPMRVDLLDEPFSDDDLREVMDCAKRIAVLMQLDTHDYLALIHVEDGEALFDCVYKSRFLSLIQKIPTPTMIATDKPTPVHVQGPCFPYDLRQFHLADMPAIIDLELESHLHPGCASETLSNIDQDKLRGCNAIVAVNESGAIMGYAFYARMGIAYQLRQLVVHPDYRRQGIGLNLFKSMQSDPVGRAHRSYVATVPESAMPYLAFLKALGFRAIQIEKEFYPDGEDAIVLALEPKLTSRPKE
jgi:ribosomal-protein-alanine N-acetyltransferase